MKIRKNKKIIITSSIISLGFVTAMITSACNANKNSDKNTIIEINKLNNFVEIKDTNKVMLKINISNVDKNSNIKIVLTNKKNNKEFQSDSVLFNNGFEVYFNNLDNGEYKIKNILVFEKNKNDWTKYSINNSDLFEYNSFNLNFINNKDYLTKLNENYLISFDVNETINNSIKITLVGDDNKEYVSVATIINNKIDFKFNSLKLNQKYKIKAIDLMNPSTNQDNAFVHFDWNKDQIFYIKDEAQIKNTTNVDVNLSNLDNLNFENDEITINLELSTPIENKFLRFEIVEVNKENNKIITESKITEFFNSNSKNILLSNLKENSRYQITNIQVYNNQQDTNSNGDYLLNLLSNTFDTPMNNLVNRTIELIYINNLNGQVDEIVWDNYKTKKQELKQPGIIRLLNEVNKIKKERGENNVKVVLGGNNYAKSHDSNITRGEYTALVTKYLEPQASAIAADDLLWSYDLVDEKQANFKTYIKNMFNSSNSLVSVNLFTNTEGQDNYKVANSSKIIDFNGFKMGLVGVSSNYIKYNSNPYITNNIITKTNQETTQLVNNEINNLQSNVNDIVLLTSLNADLTKNNELKTHDQNGFSEAFEVADPLKNTSLVLVNHYNKNFSINHNNKWYANPKANAQGFVRYQIDLNKHNRILNKRVIDVNKLSSSGNENGEDFVVLDDLLNPTTNPDFNNNLIELKNKIVEFKTNKINEIKNNVLISNNPNRLRSSNSEISSLGGYITDLIANNYEFATDIENNHFIFNKVDGVLINANSIKSSLQPNADVKVSNLLQILPYDNYFVIGDILVSDLKQEIIKDTKGQIQFNDKIKVIYEIDSQQNKVVSDIKIRNENNDYVSLNDNQTIKIALLNFMYFSTDYSFKTKLQNAVTYNKNNIRDIVWDLMLKNPTIDSKYNDSNFKTNDSRFVLTNPPVSSQPENTNNAPSNNSLNQSLPNDKLRIGHWNVLHQSGQFDLKNEALAKVIYANRYDVIGLTEIDPTIEGQDEQQKNLAVSSIVSYLNEISNSDDYSYIISDNLEGVENQSLATDKHTSTERIGVIYNNKKVQLKAFANNEIGHIYSNPLKVTKFTNEAVDYSRPPFSIKLESKNEIKNDFTIVFAHFDSPGYLKGPKKENSVTKQELIDAGLISKTDKTKRKLQGSREADNAEELINVINETLQIDENKDDDIFFMGDTNIYLHNEAWAFRTFVQAGFANLLADDENSKTSLSGNIGNFANPYDKMFVKTNLVIDNPSIYNLWNIYEDNIINNEWETKARTLNPKNASKDKLEFIRSYISDHAPTYFDLTLNPNDEK